MPSRARDTTFYFKSSPRRFSFLSLAFNCPLPSRVPPTTALRATVVNPTHVFTVFSASHKGDLLTEPAMVQAHAPGLQHCKQNSLCQCDTAEQWWIQPPGDERDPLVYFKRLLHQSARLRRAASPPRSPPLVLFVFVRGALQRRKAT